MTKEEKFLKEKIKELTAFVNSDEGVTAIKKAIADAVKAKEAFEEATKANPENLYRPMTI